MSPERRQRRQIHRAQREANRALFVDRPARYGISPRQEYISMSELDLLGRSMMRINNLVNTSSHTRFQRAEARMRYGVNRQLSEATDVFATYSAIEHGLANDPFFPELHLRAGRFFLDDSGQGPYEAFDMPFFHNVLSLVSFATASRLLPDSTEAREGMVTALQLIHSTDQVRHLNHPDLERLIEGDVLRRQEQFGDAVKQFNKIKPDSSYAWLARQQTAQALYASGDVQAAIDAAHETGRILIADGDNNSALPFFEYLAQVRPGPQSYLELAQVYHAVDDPEMVEKTLLACIHAIPNSFEERDLQVQARWQRAQFSRERGQALWSAGEHEAADIEWNTTAMILSEEAAEAERELRKDRKATLSPQL